MERSFYDFHIYPDTAIGKDSIEDIARQAERLGLSGIVMADHIKDGNKDNIDAILNKIPEIRSDNLAIYSGVVIDADDPNILNKQIRKYRKKVDIIIVSGGNSKINRAAVENPRVDILSHPERGRRDSGLDDVMVKLAAKNSVAIEIDFRKILNTYSKVRSHILNHMRINAQLAKKYGAPMIITSGAHEISEMRAGRELASIGVLIGLELSEGLDCVSVIPSGMLDHSSKVKDGNYIMQGVEIVGED